MCSNRVEKSQLQSQLPMRIGVAFSDVDSFIKKNCGTPCRMLCAVCQKAWKVSGSESVNLLYLGRIIYYVCDKCVASDELSHIEKKHY